MRLGAVILVVYITSMATILAIALTWSVIDSTDKKQMCEESGFGNWSHKTQTLNGETFIECIERWFDDDKNDFNESKKWIRIGDGV